MVTEEDAKNRNCIYYSVARFQLMQQGNCCLSVLSYFIPEVGNVCDILAYRIHG